MQFGTKLSPLFGFAKSSQIQNQLSIKPNTQIRCSCCALCCYIPNFSILDFSIASKYFSPNVFSICLSSIFHAISGVLL